MTHTARRRDADVLRSAIKIFYERGYAAASVQDVADDLGILKGSLYHYIRRKEDLLYRLYECVHEDVDTFLDEARYDPAGDPMDHLRSYVEAQLIYNLDNIPAVSVYYHEFGDLNGERWNPIRDSRRRHELFVEGLLAKAQGLGRVDQDRDVRVLVPCVFAAIIWPYRWYRAEGRLSRGQIAQEVTDFAIRGVASRSYLESTGSRSRSVA